MKSLKSIFFSQLSEVSSIIQHAVIRPNVLFCRNISTWSRVHFAIVAKGRFVTGILFLSEWSMYSQLPNILCFQFLQNCLTNKPTMFPTPILLGFFSPLVLALALISSFHFHSFSLSLSLFFSSPSFCISWIWMHQEFWIWTWIQIHISPLASVFLAEDSEWQHAQTVGEHRPDFNLCAGVKCQIWFLYLTGAK